jgi:hypothetical protein
MRENESMTLNDGPFGRAIRSRQLVVPRSMAAYTGSCAALDFREELALWARCCRRTTMSSPCYILPLAVLIVSEQIAPGSMAIIVIAILILSQNRLYAKQEFCL